MSATTMTSLSLLFVLTGLPGGPGVVVTPSPAADRPAPRPARQTAPPPDSAERVRRARKEQERFERVRRRHLPGTSLRPAARCDEVVGRYCFWHDDRDWEPPTEDGAVIEARERLLDVLERAAAAAPADPWIAGQRVRYLLQAGRDSAARVAVRRCRAGRAWCRALRGRVLHALGEYAAAGAAFDSALAALPPDERREWTDLRILLEGRLRGRYGEASPEGRARIAGWIWWLADPLRLVPGNDRRTEHFTRWVIDRTRRDADSLFDTYWADDLRELLLRYGWPVGWEREWPSRAPPGRRPRIVAHHDPDARHFLPLKGPVAKALEGASGSLDPAGLAELSEDAWRPDHDRPRSVHAPAYADTFPSLIHQMAVFLRHDSARIVAAYRFGGNPGEPSVRVESLLEVAPLRPGPPPGEDVPRDRREAGGPSGVLRVTAPAGPSLLSLEALDRHGRRAERVRRGLPLAAHPEGALGISDLLVVDPGRRDTLPAVLDSVAPRAVAETRARAGSRIGLYWELYGPGSRLDGAEVRVELEGRKPGFFGRIGRKIGLAGGEAAEVGLRWNDRAEPGERVHGRSLVLTLPEELGSGEHRLVVEVRIPGYEPLRTRRPLRVESP